MADSNSTKTIQLEEEVEGDIIETADYFFERIGESVPLTSDEDFQYDLQNPPSRPLAVSERDQLVFVAHSSGFWVARTSDVVESANAIKAERQAPSIQELSIVDVRIGEVYILALSADYSTLAATVGGDIHFFSVTSLLNKQQKPSYSCSLNDSICVKDMKWIKKLDKSFVVLSSHGRLYHGVHESPLEDVMDNVDAVEWSVRGNLVAVARKNILSILSSTFKERLRMSLSFKSWGGVSDCIIQVDSIKWVRPDCIIIGCLQLTADGMEENYLVQVITTKSGKFTDGSSEPVVLSFCDIFLGLNDDIVPSGSGPHLFLTYLDQCELAIAVNRKNTDQHIVLIGWSKGDENSKAAVIDIDRDQWLPRIELQENGDDNLILGLSVDKVSVYGKVKVQLGVEDERELPPYCVIFCLTLEGKLTMFHVASVAEPANQPPTDSVFPDEEDEDSTPSVLRLEHNLSKVSSGSGGERSEDVVVCLQSHDVNKKELRMEGADEHKNDLKSFEKNFSSTSKVIDTGRQEVKTQVNFQKYEAEEQQKAPKLGQYQDTIGQQLRLSGWQSTELEQLDLKPFQLEGASILSRDLSKGETQIIAEVGYSTDSFLGKSRSDMSREINKDSQKRSEVGKVVPGKIGLTGLQSGSSQVWSNGKSVSLKDSDGRYSGPTSSSVEGHSRSLGIANTLGEFSGSPLFSKVTNTQSALVNSFNGPTQNGGQRASTRMGNIEPLPSIRSSQFKTKDEKLPNYKLPSTTEKYRSSSQSGQLSVEPKLSKQFGNINDLTEKLDELLECIEETGGFRDASTVVQNESLIALEQGIVTLSEKYRKFESILDERHKEVQHLLDKTVQVLARKVHIEGILKQATDSRYWDLWNRQKLSSELELKRRHIVEVNQDLTSQLIELERHFNTLELNKFGDDGGCYLGRKSQSKFGPSRHIQSLHSLHNTMSSQLAAAEQLSECLLKQMSVLSIESPERRQNVRKELFETIGIPYDGASFSSPDTRKANNTSSVKKLPSSSNSVANKDQSRRKQSSLMKNFEPETARRRRDSLDRSWASFEPPKTTVRRSVFKEIQKVKANQSVLSMDKQQLRPHMLEGTVVPHLNNQTTPSTFLYPSGNKGIQDVVQKQASERSSTSLFKWANDITAPLQSVGTKSPTLQRNNFQAFPSQPAPQPFPHLCRSIVRDSGDFTAERQRSDASFFEKSDSVLLNETKSNLHSETGLLGAPSIPTRPPFQTQSELNKSSVMSNLNSKETLLPTTSGSAKQLPVTNKSLSFESGKGHDSPYSRMSLTPPAPKFPGRDFQFDSASKSQPGEKVLPSSASSASLSTPSISPLNRALSAPQSSLPSLSSIASASSASLSLNESFTIAKANVESNQTVSSISTSSSSTSPLHSSGSFSFQAYETPVPSYIPSPPLTSASDSPRTEVQRSVGNFSLKTDAIAAEPTLSLQGPPSTGEFCLKHEPSVSSAPATEVSTRLASGNQPSLSNVTSPASVLLNNQPEQPSSSPVSFQASLSTSASATAGKLDSSNNAVTQEDEMEEEASETNQAAALSLGSLGGFGFGPSPNSAAPGKNPFGGPFGNTAANAGGSPFTLTNPTGELFRPASLSFQSPQPSQPSQQTVLGPFSGGFGIGTTAQAPTGSGFGQPSQIGPGQQALGSVLGGFGQSRQLGSGLPVTGFASASSFGGGFASSQPTGGFANSATGGGFAGAASGGGGFAALASGGGGFANMAPAAAGFSGVAPAAAGFSGVSMAGGGFGGGGFAGAASGSGFPTAGSGFGGFSNQQGSGGFSTFGSAGTGKPSSQLFTQMRK